MTREETIKRIKMILEEATANEDAVSYVTSDDVDALAMAIKALEQQDIIDKIRAEIDQYLFQNEFGLEYRKEVSQIIDKYKAEGSDKEPLYNAG